MYYIIGLFLLLELYAGQLVLVAQHSGPLRELLALWPHNGQSGGEQDICLFFYMCPGTTVVGCTVPRRDSSRWLIVNYLR